MQRFGQAGLEGARLVAQFAARLAVVAQVGDAGNGTQVFSGVLVEKLLPVPDEYTAEYLRTIAGEAFKRGAGTPVIFSARRMVSTRV